MFKNTTIKTPFAAILKDISFDVLEKANLNCHLLVASYIDDYTEYSRNEFIAEFLQENASKMDIPDITELIANPDQLILSASEAFYDAIGMIICPNGSIEDKERLINSAKIKFESSGDYYVYANPWSNVCCDYYIMRANSATDADQLLTCEFEKDFIVEESDIVKDDYLVINENGNPINTDNLMFLGVVSFEN